MVALGEGGMHGCSGGGHAWLLPGACVVALGGACMVALGGHVWFSVGGVCDFLGGMHGFLGGVCGFFDEIRSMSRRYASYWNAFLSYMCARR